MKRRVKAFIAIGASTLIFITGALTANLIISSKITSRVENELPKASGISASIPLIDIPQNLASGTIKSADINIESYVLERSNTRTSLAITANSISKKKPTIVGSLEVTATIPAKTILENAQFESAEIVGKTLQISVGAGGLGKAQLVPRYSNNQIYFYLESVSILGSKIPASSLPSDLQSQIKSKSIQNLELPKGLKVRSVALSSKGLSIQLRGSDIQLGNLGSTL